MKPNIKLVLEEIEDHKREKAELKARIADLGAQLLRSEIALVREREYHGVLLGYIRSLEGGESLVLKQMFNKEFKEYQGFCKKKKLLVSPYEAKKRSK